MMIKKTPLIALTLLVAAPSLAMAHPGHGVHGFGEGLLHPLSGLDHLLAIMAISLLAVRAGGRELWALPLAFMACCVVGGLVAAAGVALPMVELTIAASVLVGGVLLARGQAVPVLAMVMLPLFGVAHGYAHIHELANMSAVASYSCGIVMASVALMGVTIAIAKLAQRQEATHIWTSTSRLIGSGMAVAALVMLVS